MDKTGQVSVNKSSLGYLAVDGLIYGLVSGMAMILCLVSFTWLAGESTEALLVRFSVNSLASPWYGLIGHLSASAIYGALFGALLWLVRIQIASREIIVWTAGIIYAIILLLVAQNAILPNTSSPLDIIPFWQWLLGHVVYGVVLGGLFARKLSVQV